MDVNQSTFLICGAASGLGAATARILHARGANVCLADLDDATGSALAEELGGSTRFVPADVTLEQDVRSAVEVATTLGPLRGAINCAGILHAARLAGRDGPYPLDAFSRVIQVNLVGTFNVMRLAAAAMVENEPLEDRERGLIINTASVAAWDGQVGQASYAASKAGVVGMTLPAARELAAHGIRVVAIAPGVFETPMMAGLKSDVREALEAEIPFPTRHGRPSEFGELVVHICQNRMLNGTTLRLDGALRMR